MIYNCKLYLIRILISDVFCVFPQAFRQTGLLWWCFPLPHGWLCPANGRHSYCEAATRMNLFLPKTQMKGCFLPWHPLPENGKAHVLTSSEEIVVE